MQVRKSRGALRLQPMHRGLLAICAVLVVSAAPARAGVVRVEIRTREAFAEGRSFGRSGPYERIAGRMFLEVDPGAPANARVVDLSLAPRNARGRVEFATDFFLLKPVDATRGNRRLLYDVNNRGNKLALGAFNDRGGNDPRTVADAGNGFLMREGYSILWCGWNGDVRGGDGRMLIDLPVATDNGRPITGPVHAEIVVNDKSFSQPFYWGNSDPYPSVELDNRQASVMVRPWRSAEAIELPRSEWAFARYENGAVIPDAQHLYLKDGFRPGWLYDLVYVARDPRVTGLGFAAVRDVVSHVRYGSDSGPEPLPPLTGEIEHVYIFGISQSARFIQHFVFEGFNGDELGRGVFDGALAHVGGGGRGWFNHRFAQTTRHGSQHEDNWSPSEVFPFTSRPQEDPLTGERGDTLSRARRRGPTPKIVYTETSAEYWCRAASLLHTDVNGQADVGLDPETRLYFITGAQHGVASSPDRGIYQNQINILDHRPVLRAMLKALDAWVTSGAEPPKSRYPQIADQTLVDVETYRQAFPAIRGVALPASNYRPMRLDFGPRFRDEGIADNVPPKVGPAYRTLVPAIDSDGNELAGIRLPDVAVPLATLTGWNLRAESVGAEGALGRWSGSYLPFAKTVREREETGDPRPSLAERYATRDEYLAKVAAAAVALRDEGFLLDEDVVAIVKTASAKPW